jgi:uracil-DNA glycosylase family 4
MPQLSQYQQHKARWSECRLCDLCERRSKVVLLRGTVPAKVLFVGEAPGESEDVLGKPFIGPAGQLLDRMIAAARIPEGSYALTNVIACIPRDEENNKLIQPPYYALEACAGRLIDCIQLVKPKLIVWVGKVAADWGSKLLVHSPIQDITTASIVHPAAILKMHVSQQGLVYQKAVVSLADAYEELVS